MLSSPRRRWACGGAARSADRRRPERSHSGLVDGYRVTASGARRARSPYERAHLAKWRYRRGSHANGFHAHEANEKKDALGEVDRALALNPNLPEAYTLRGRLAFMAADL